MVTTRGKAAIAAAAAATITPSYEDSDDEFRKDEESEDGESEDEESEDEESEDEESEDEEIKDEDDITPQNPTFGAQFISKAYKAYYEYARKRPLQIKQYLPTTQALWETYFQLDWNFDKSLEPILQSPTPPTIATLKSLPEFAYEDEPAFSVYLLILKKEKNQVDDDDGEDENQVDDDDDDGEDENQVDDDDDDGEDENQVDDDDDDGEDEDLPLTYIGSGTSKTTGTQGRFEDYDNGEKFSSLTTLAYQNGYQITHKKILITAPCPSTNLSMLSARALFLVLETALMYELHAYADRVPSHATLTNNKWNGSSVLYKGLCTHEAWREGVRVSKWLTAGLSQEEVEEAKRQRSREYGKSYNKEKMAAETAEEREERLRKVCERMANKRANETAEEREERLQTAREKMANETAEETEERLRKVRESMANETTEEREERNRKVRERKASKRIKIE